ncbi:CPBP family glutamic-type intramembrane protease [Paenibacillus ihuae]|uniref:CPBP family glutamic-type intramembrane protease n=1 Tax=Paenibacillus ihuae TaxID=1232431 RepID=UPI0006D539D7|nr:CPBP family glutamic-type intramembrane protease [Paenibacillus ihuae]
MRDDSYYNGGFLGVANMRKYFMLAFISITLLLSSGQVYACTSFAVYSKDIVLYGMNFDYPDAEIMLKPSQKGSIKVFSIMFKDSSKGAGGEFSPTVQYNSKGLFISSQMQYPQTSGKSRPGKGEFYFDAMDNYLYSTGDSNIIKEFLVSNRIVQYPYPTLHRLVADKNGNAMIVESGDHKNEMITMKNDFIIMTNYKNSDYTNTDAKFIQGIGADRYKVASEYLSKYMNVFNIDRGLELLSITKQDTGNYPTQCTMLFDPQNNEIYISFKGNFNKVWKWNVDKRTIETYKGFHKYTKILIPVEGITVSELLHLNKSKSDSAVALEIPFAVIIVGLFILALMAFTKINNKRILYITWSVLALGATFSATYLLQGSYPILTFIWILVPFIYLCKSNNVHEIPIKEMPIKKFLKYMNMNLCVVLVVFAVFEPWSSTYKSFIHLVSKGQHPDTTFAWLNQYDLFSSLAGMYFYSGFVTMFGEELFFRGYLLHLLRAKIGNKRAIFVQSALFSLCCGAPMFMFMSFTQGVIFTIYAMTIGIAGGWTVLRTGSILPSLFTAATTNLILVVLFR